MTGDPPGTPRPDLLTAAERLAETRFKPLANREGQQVLAVRQWAIQESLARAERIEARGGAATPMSQVLADAQLIEAYLRGGSTS